METRLGRGHRTRGAPGGPVLGPVLENADEDAVGAARGELAPGRGACG